MVDWKVRIRGVYSTALTKLILDFNEALGFSPRTLKLKDSENMFLKLLSPNLEVKLTSKPSQNNLRYRNTVLSELMLDRGFDIVQPSFTMKERFGLEERDDSPDIDIHDRLDRQGIQVFGNSEALNAFKSILRSFLEDVVVRKGAASVDGTYKGLIKEADPETQSILVDIGPVIGRIAQGEILDPNARQVVVQVDNIRTWNKEPTLTTRITIPGKYAVLIPSRQVKISRKIRDARKRSRLLQFGEELASQEWGILWRTAAAEQSFSVLRNEITRLMKEAEAIREKAEGVMAPATLRDRNYFMDVEFPAMSKKKLDLVRASVTPTMKGHHYYKACGDEISSVLDMAERLLEKGCPHKEVEDLFEDTIDVEYPSVGSEIEVIHGKLDGKVFNLGTALIESYDQNESKIQFSRIFKVEGVYDGLGTRKEVGDRAITEAKIGEWHLKTKYFSRDNQYKGTYINLNTPIELYPHGIRYVDLEVDVCVWPEGRFKVLDEDKLFRAVAEELVTDKMVQIVRKKQREILEQLRR